MITNMLQYRQIFIGGFVMGIMDYFRKKQEQKPNNTSLINSDKSANNLSLPRRKKIRNIVDFVEDALVCNGGDYQDIYDKLLAMSEFAKHAKEYGVKCSLSKIDEALKDFFTEQKDIKHFPIKGIPYAAFYAKKDGWNYYNYRGVSVMQGGQAGKPIMYFGRRNKRADTFRQDTALAFGDDIVVLRDENSANYDEIPLYGSGAYAEFSFDENNHITAIKYRYLEHHRIGLWSDDKTCVFDAESGQYKLLTSQIPERTNNDPKSNNSSMSKLSKTILDADCTTM